MNTAYKKHWVLLFGIVSSIWGGVLFRVGVYIKFVFAVFCAYILMTRMVFADSCDDLSLQTSNVSFGTYSVDYSMPIGGVIANISAPSTPGYGIRCRGTIVLGLNMLRYNQISSYGQHVYKTNLPGVGIRMYNNPGAAAGYTFDNPKTTMSYPADSTNSWDGGYVQLIKIGRVNSGLVAAGNIGSVSVLGYDGVYHDAVIISMTNATINSSGCGVTTPAVNVALGEYSTTQFGNMGSTTEAKLINIKLDCNEGTRINATISANADVSQLGTIKLISDAGSASGVGVQLLDSKSSPLLINKQFNLDTTKIEGEYEITWQARYIKTSSAITPGQANASATLALNYE